MKAKKARSSHFIFIILLFLIAIMLIYGIYGLYTSLTPYVVEANYMNNIRAKAVTTKNEPNVESNAVTNESVKDDFSVYVDFDCLKKLNSDCIGYIVVPGTKLSYPILKSSDNSDYLNLSLEKKKNKSGSVFMDYRCNSDFTSPNTIIYGHNMKDGSMFRTLNNYNDQSYYKEHPNVYIINSADGKTHKYNILSVFPTSPTSELAYALDYSNEFEYLKFLDSIKSSSLYDTEVTYNNMKPIITLSTCRGSNKRFVMYLQEDIPN